MPRTKTKQPTTTKLDRLKQAHDRLTQAVKSIVSGDDWQRMLKVASKFHNYSSGGITYSILLNSRERQFRN